MGTESAGEPSPTIGNISPRAASANLSYEIIEPKGLTWDRFLRDYVPNPVTITMILRNIGTLAAQGGELSLSFNTDGLVLLDTNKRKITIAEIQPGDSVIVSWDVTARRRTMGDSLSVLLTAVFSNHPTITGNARFWIPQAGPILVCCLTTQEITVNFRNQLGDQSLCEIVLPVCNEGGMRTDTVFARIELPPGDLKLAGVDAPNRHTKKTFPAILSPTEQGSSVSWMLSHPTTTGPRTYRVVIWLRTSNADSTKCEGLVVIPGQATTPVRLRLDSVVAKSSSIVRVPVLLDDTLTNATFNPAKFTVNFDDNCVQFLNIATPTHALLSGARFKTTLKPGSVAVELLDTMIVSRSGVLIELVFYTTEAPKGGVRFCPMNWGSWLFDTGTLLPMLTDGAIRIMDKPLLVSTTTAPTIIVDRLNQRYNPMPFEVTLKVKNIGTIASDTIYARIELPPWNLKLADADAPDRNTKALKGPILFPGEEGTESWTLSHPITTVEMSYTIRIWVRSSNTDSVMCETHVVIPPLVSPILNAQCLCPDSLSFNEMTGTYTPDPFVVAVEAVNIGGWLAQNVRSEILLPPDVEFADSNETALKYYNPSTMPEYKGGPVPRVEWRLRYKKISSKEAWLNFKVKTMGEGEGYPLDTIMSACMTRVSAVYPSLSSDRCINHPDSIIVKPDGSGLEPNPFKLSWTLWNEGWQSLTINRVTVDYPIDQGIRLDSSTPQTQFPNKILYHADTVTFSWLFSVDHQLQPRVPRFTITAWDDDNNPIQCGDSIPIATANPDLTGCTVISDTLIRFNTTTNRYEPSRFVVEGQLTNSGNINLDSLFVSLVWTDTSGLDLLEIEPGYQNPVLLQNVTLLQFNNVSWNVRIKNPNVTGRDQRISFAIRYRVPGLIDTMVTCTDELVIKSSIQTGITSMVPQKAILHQNYPNPFNPTTMIEFELPIAAHARLAVFDVLGREVRELVNERHDAGLHRIRFEADGLPGGVYLYRLEAGGKVLMRQMAVVK